jgi:hypothetical protein
LITPYEGEYRILEVAEPVDASWTKETGVLAGVIAP